MRLNELLALLQPTWEERVSQDVQLLVVYARLLLEFRVNLWQLILFLVLWTLILDLLHNLRYQLFSRADMSTFEHDGRLL